MSLGTEVGLGLSEIVFDVDPATPEKGHTHPHPILGHVCCGQMAGWMKTPRGREVDLSPGHIVLDGVPVSAKRAVRCFSFIFVCCSRCFATVVFRFLSRSTHSEKFYLLVKKLCDVSFHCTRTFIIGQY